MNFALIVANCQMCNKNKIIPILPRRLPNFKTVVISFYLHIRRSEANPTKSEFTTTTPELQ
jgi:hypothetical protein